MVSVVKNLRVSPCFAFSGKKLLPRFRVRVSSVSEGKSAVVDGVSVNGEKSKVLGEEGNGKVVLNGREGKSGNGVVRKKLEPLWDDGYGNQTVKDYLELAEEFIKPDGGPPRWFCPVECGEPLENAPVLLFLPGMDGLGMGLILHHKALGEAFEVRCLHIPVRDKTPFEDLVKFVEYSLRSEYAASPNKPIYLVGDSFGGSLALAVASRNPTMDLVLILANPATSFGRSQLQPIFPLLEALPEELQVAVPYLLSGIMGDPMKMAMVNIDTSLPRTVITEKMSANLTALLPLLSSMSDIIPKDTLLWKLKLLRSAAAYANSRLHAVTAEVLILASGKDNMLPSKDEAQRLSSSLRNCKICYFKDNGHTILLEDDVNLLTMIKGNCKYRRSRKHDFIKDFIPPSMSEYKKAVETYGSYRYYVSPVMLSTMPDGKIVRGLAGVPSEGPVLLVGYHMLLGTELVPLALEFLREKKVMIRGLTHPTLFTQQAASTSNEFSFFDLMKVFGSLPVTPSNLFKLFSTKSHGLLYPGGAREALHRKGEEYKLFWPDQPEFVRMAAKFGTTIVPFGVVGEDDVAELVLDYNDYMKIPIISDRIKKSNEEGIRLRTDMGGEIANQDLYLPGLLPKIPGRFYFLFGKPIQTKGKEKVLKNRDSANELYLQIKSEVEDNIAYLLKKRKEDPYRNILDRTLYRAFDTSIDEAPSFEL
ncbi:Acyltransferase-like protein, chloroplastic [Heracleum sosnowskyi]|uniref:Acyltransferase-like protein, chloroplastic n=1 Tax=Heracleum sosnowskyi TaxID=360622 RepID=A0AAD8JB54_9APIA|nr:Acyltransferase-like protein, chloroplastic [Heracleum sosnowskyi]